MAVDRFLGPVHRSPVREWWSASDSLGIVQGRAAGAHESEAAVFAFLRWGGVMGGGRWTEVGVGRRLCAGADVWRSQRSGSPWSSDDRGRALAHVSRRTNPLRRRGGDRGRGPGRGGLAVRRRRGSPVIAGADGRRPVRGRHERMAVCPRRPDRTGRMGHRPGSLSRLVPSGYGGPGHRRRPSQTPSTRYPAPQGPPSGARRRGRTWLSRGVSKDGTTSWRLPCLSGP